MGYYGSFHRDGRGGRAARYARRLETVAALSEMLGDTSSLRCFSLCVSRAAFDAFEGAGLPVAPLLQAKLAHGLANNTSLTSLRLDWRLSTDDVRGSAHLRGRPHPFGLALQRALVALTNLRTLTLGSRRFGAGKMWLNSFAQSAAFGAAPWTSLCLPLASDYVVLRLAGA